LLGLTLPQNLTPAPATITLGFTHDVAPYTVADYDFPTTPTDWADQSAFLKQTGTGNTVFLV